MKLYTIIAFSLLAFLMTGCLGEDEETPNNLGEVMGTVFVHKHFDAVKGDAYYIVNDTAVGASEVRLYINNDSGLSFENNTRIIMTFKTIGSINDSAFWADYINYSIIPTRKIEVVDNGAADTLAKDIVSLKRLFTSHDFLNFEFTYNYNDLGKHYFYVTEDIAKRPEKDTILLNFHHRDSEKLPNYYKTYKNNDYSIFYNDFISVPISELKNIYPEQDSIFIKVVSEQEGLSDNIKIIQYRYGDFIVEEEGEEEE